MTKASSVDLKEVARLVQALEDDLARVQAGSGDFDALRAEVEALRAALQAPDQSEVRERLEGVHGFLGEAEGTAIKSAQYIGDIGRMLGM